MSFGPPLLSLIVGTKKGLRQPSLRVTPGTAPVGGRGPLSLTFPFPVLNGCDKSSLGRNGPLFHGNHRLQEKNSFFAGSFSLLSPTLDQSRSKAASSCKIELLERSLLFFRTLSRSTPCVNHQHKGEFFLRRPPIRPLRGDSPPPSSATTSTIYIFFFYIPF